MLERQEWIYADIKFCDGEGFIVCVGHETTEHTFIICCFCLFRGYVSDVEDIPLRPPDLPVPRPLNVATRHPASENNSPLITHKSHTIDILHNMVIHVPAYIRTLKWPYQEDSKDGQ
jgi:hypothetical protein